MLEARAQQMKQDGRLDFTRVGLAREVRRALSETAPAPKPTDRATRKQTRLDSFSLLEHKLDKLLELAYPKPPQATLHRLPQDAVLTVDGLIFWDKQCGLAVGDLIELQAALFPDAPVLLRTYARVAQIQLGENGLNGVTCLYEQHPNYNRKPQLQAEEPEEELVEEVVDEVEEVKQAAPAAYVPPPPPPPPKPIDDDGANRRQAFRVNDEIPFLWRVVTQQELDEAGDHLSATREILPSRIERDYLSALEMISELRTTVRKAHPKADKNTEWFCHQLKARFQRANLADEVALHMRLLNHLGNVLREFAKLGVPCNRPTQIFQILRRQLEAQNKQSVLRRNPAADKKAVEEGIALKKRIEKEIAKGMELLDPKEMLLGAKLQQFSNDLEELGSVNEDYPSPEDDSLSELITYPVNLSANGVAFRTRKHELHKGMYVEMLLKLNPDGREWRQHRCYGKVVMIKGPDSSHRMRVASMILVQTTQFQEQLYQHIVRKQREQLSDRVEVAGY
ncbi:hypothetical protein MAIT1_02629 [Magnetofaba australis IT-1]|uniref:PilZ domain-containing protein n=1 Tax=Magnetofaba australis IT-1 TaxID=1434232 RepID=A0A1Y2K3B3_9PROT|nr:hypothetical protein MAIT1_02629 [Magnetofaba australis IT-1]